MSANAKKLDSAKLISRLTTEPVSDGDDWEQNRGQYDYSEGINHYDDLFLQALHDHSEGRIPRDEDGNFKHPTTHAFHIGIESVLTGRPSMEFLQRLLDIAEAAEDRDVLQFAFPDKYRKIKSGSVGTARLYAEIASAFIKHLKDYQSDPRRFVQIGKGEKAMRVRKIDYAEAKRQFKGYGPYQNREKTVDRALAKHNLNWRAYSISTTAAKS